MKIAFIKKQLVNGIDNINIPQKEQLLPAAAFEKSTPIKPRIYYKRIATAAAAVVVIVSVILGVNSINFNSVTPTPQPIDTRPIIYGTDSNDLPTGIQNDSLYEGQQANGISESLQQKMEKYVGRDVLFSVYVRFPRLSKYANGFVKSDELTNKLNEINAKIDPIVNEISQLQKIYPYRGLDPSIPELKEMTEEEEQRLYPHLDDLTEAEIKSIKKQIDDLWDELDPLIDERFDYFDEEAIEEREYYSANLRKEIEAVKNMSGDATIRKFTGHSEIAKYSLTNTYIMELTADTINKIAERGTTDIYLALPERTGDYSKKISDTLTYYLEQMDEEDIIEIAAVSMIDKASQYAWAQNLTRNEDTFNEENFKAWPFKAPTESFTYTEFNKIIDNYINEIMVRNNIADKRIIHDKLPWLGVEKLPWYEDDILVMAPSEEGHYIIAGFNARLTKAEILSLVNEEEIKTLYFVGDIDSSLPGSSQND